MNWTPQNHQAALVKVSEIFDESQFKCWDELLYDLYQADLNLYPTKNYPGYGKLYVYWAVSYGYAQASTMSEILSLSDVHSHCLSRRYQAFALTVMNSFTYMNRKFQLPLMGLTTLIKSKGLSKGLQNTLYNLGVCSSYMTTHRYENAILSSYKKKVFKKWTQGSSLWLDNLARLVVHSTLNKGSYASLQLSVAGFISTESHIAVELKKTIGNSQQPTVQTQERKKMKQLAASVSKVHEQLSDGSWILRVLSTEQIKIPHVMRKCYTPYMVSPYNPGSNEGLKKILDDLENNATQNCFPEDALLLLVVDINIYWRLSKWILSDINLSQWQRSSLVPCLGAWHPMKIACERVWANHFTTFFVPLYAFVWPTSTILRKPRLSQLLFLMDILFEIFSDRYILFSKLREECISSAAAHKAKEREASDLGEQTKQKKKRRRLSSVSIPLHVPTSSLPPPSSEIPASYTDVLHPNHIHLCNLLNLFHVFLPIILLYKKELRSSSLQCKIQNYHRLLYLFCSCPSPSYISALFLQLQQFHVWKLDFPQVLEFFKNNATLLMEDLGELSLTSINRYTPGVIQSTDLLSKNYLLSGYYSTIPSSDLKPTPQRTQKISHLLKAKVVNFLSTYMEDLQKPTPYSYYPKLPPHTHKLNPSSISPSISLSPPLILQPPDKCNLLLKKYATKCFSLLGKANPKSAPKNRKAPGASKKRKKTTREDEEIYEEEEEYEEEDWELMDNNEKDDEQDHQFLFILQHKTYAREGGQKGYTYLVEYEPADADGTNQEWMDETELIDCEALLEDYWGENLDKVV